MPLFSLFRSVGYLKRFSKPKCMPKYFLLNWAPGDSRRHIRLLHLGPRVQTRGVARRLQQAAPLRERRPHPLSGQGHSCQMANGYSQIFRSYVFGPSGFWTMAPLCYAAKFDPFLSLDCAPTPSTLAQSKERKGSNFAIWQP